MKRKKCTKKDCDKLAIDYSEQCGDHSDGDKVVAALVADKRTELDGLYLNDLTIKDQVFEGKTFSHANFGGAEFEGVTFKDCKFYGLDSYDTFFNECLFEGCEVADSELEDVNFLECKFISCQFLSVVFNQSDFSYLKYAAYVLFDKCSFVGGGINDTGELHDLRFISCKLVMFSFNRAEIRDTQFDECIFNKTTWFDCQVTDCVFAHVVHDFGEIGPPELCDFSRTRFIDTSIDDTFREWNLMDGDRVSFFKSIADLVADQTETDYLHYLGVALHRLHEEGYWPDIPFQRMVGGIFQRFFDNAAAKNNISEAGDIISEYGGIPEEYRVTSFMLPASRALPTSAAQGELRIRVELKPWTLQGVSKFFQLLSDLIECLPDKRTPVIIDRITQGSLESSLYGDIKDLATSGRLLSTEKAKLETDNLAIEKRLNEIKLEKEEDSLKFHKEERSLTLKSKAADLVLKELEIMEKKLDLFKKVETLYGGDFEKFIRTPQGQQAKKLAEEIQVRFPILDLEVSLLELPEGEQDDQEQQDNKDNQSGTT